MRTFVRFPRSGHRVYFARSYSTSWIPEDKLKYVPSDGYYPQGFKVSGTFVGIKPSNTTKSDLAFIVSDRPCAAAAVFTKNKFQAAPVTFSRSLLQRKGGIGFHSVLINSGCANAVTGKGGLEDVEAMADEADRVLGVEQGTIVMSTGVIGQRLPLPKIIDKIPLGYQALGSTHQHWLECAAAICTTDTFPKLLSKTFSLPSSPSVKYSITGLTKGAGMIHPNMATLLGVIVTDAPIASNLLPGLLKGTVDKSFNSITIDGDTSTNDTVALLANGAAGGPQIDSDESPDYKAFRGVLTDISTELAQLVVRDGEGATKFVTITVSESASEQSARKIASTIARSPLVKTALYSMDANWGRILCAVGYSLLSEPGSSTIGAHDSTGTGADIDSSKTSVSLASKDGEDILELLVNGEPQVVDEGRAAEILRHQDIEILVQLGTGRKEAKHWTCDLSHEFITINADYRS